MQRGFEQSGSLEAPVVFNSSSRPLLQCASLSEQVGPPRDNILSAERVCPCVCEEDTADKETTERVALWAVKHLHIE